MDAPPVNRLLQLLRQKPAEPLGPDPPVLAATSATVSAQDAALPAPAAAPASRKKSDTQYATSDTLCVTKNASKSSILYATSDTQCATKSSIQPATFSDTQCATSDTQCATKSDTPPVPKSSTRYATNDAEPQPRAKLSKGQQRVLQFLLSHRDTTTPSQTIPVGYDAISSYCMLSRSGSRKVIGELCKKGLIARLDTRRGETQGSIYLLASSTLSTTQSDLPGLEKSSTPYATFDASCSSSKKLLLQGLVLEHAFQDLNPRSLLPYLDQFDTTDELQNFLDVANACITAAKDGQGKPIQNPYGFLFAQLRAGYINPPEGYKSRKVRAQERKNQQLEEELATLRRLKEREQALQFELFVAQLPEEDLARLDREAQAQVKPNIGLSPAFQMQLHKDALLKQWFAQRHQPQPDLSGEP